MTGLPELDLESLRLILWIEELGSIGAAAGRAGISQPSASAKLKAFEVRWRLSLVQRSTHGSQLTTDGKAVSAWARAVLSEADVMRASIVALSAGRRAGLVVAASLTIAEFILPRWLGELHAKHPDISPLLRVVNSVAVARLVRNGQADLGFIESTDVPNDLASRRVGTDIVDIVVLPDHPWALSSSPIALSELRSAKYLLREPGSGTRSTFERALGEKPNVSFEASSTAALIGAALAGLGPAVVSATAVASHIELGRLVPVAHPLDLSRPLTAVWKPEKQLRDAGEQLIDIAVGRAHGRSRVERRTSV